MSAVGDYLWSIFAKKVIQGAVAGFLSAQGANLAGAGITIDQQALIAFLVGALNGLRNWLKVKQGWKWL